MSMETSRVEDLGRELGEAIADLPAYERYESAERAVENSEAAQAEIQSFEQKRQEFMLLRQSGDATQEDLADLQRAQQELHQIPEMEEYIEAQSELDAKLERINEAISEPLTVDFGEEAGSCCQD